MKRFVCSIFSDDVRQEVSNKYSLIGIYQGGLNVFGKCPVTVTRLVISVLIYTDVKEPIKTLKIDVSINNKIIQSIEPPPSIFADSHAATTMDPLSNHICAQVVVVIQPFQIDEEQGLVKVLATIDGEEYESNGLSFRVVAPPEEVQ